MSALLGFAKYSRLYFGQGQLSSTQLLPEPQSCPSYWESLVTTLLHMPALTHLCLPRIPQGDAQTKRHCLMHFSHWPFHAAKQSRFAGTQYILFSCFYMVGVKAKIAPDRVKHASKTFIQSSCNRGECSELNSAEIGARAGSVCKLWGEGWSWAICVC